MIHDPNTIYQAEKEKYAGQLSLLLKKQSRFGWLRLALILVTAIAGYQVFTFAGAWAWLVIITGIGLFLWVVSIDTDNNKKIKFLKALARINEEELSILAGDFSRQYDGSVFAPEVHVYANDLDLFGRFSIFQWLNRCAGEQGRSMLANDLLHPLEVSTIRARQEAADEIAPKYQWRQQLQAHAAETALTKATEQRLEHWLAQPDVAFTQKAWKWVVPVYTLFACGIALAAILDLISGSLFSLFFILFIITAFSLGKQATATSAHLSGVVNELETLQQVLQCLETPSFKAPMLKELQQSIIAGDKPASAQIRNLKAILGRFDLRFNVFLFFFLNSFLLWDVRQIMSLNKWRQTNRVAAGNWFQAVGLAEVLNSLATLRFNKPHWVQPQFATEYFTFKSTAIGHPLLKEDQRVTSDFSLAGRGRIALITGSNMAGKSTFLRSLGVNIVLVQLGAVVCAKSLVLSPVQLLSSMRIADNLAENTSTFYAELKKLKTIIEEVRTHRPVLVLLDEILRGTNSLDRHTGSKALIGQLIREQSVAVMATHDVELAKLQNQYPEQIENYHFDVQVEGEELFFDYKLKDGVCTNLNASVLMKKIGIELET